MVELAIILPMFLLLVFGVIQFGITYNNLITLRQGTREGGPPGRGRQLREHHVVLAHRS